MLKTMDIQYSNDGKTAEFNGNHYARDDETGYYLCRSEERRVGKECGS